MIFLVWITGSFTGRLFHLFSMPFNYHVLYVTIPQLRLCDSFKTSPMKKESLWISFSCLQYLKVLQESHHLMTLVEPASQLGAWSIQPRHEVIRNLGLDNEGVPFNLKAGS